MKDKVLKGQNGHDPGKKEEWRHWESCTSGESAPFQFESHNKTIKRKRKVSTASDHIDHSPAARVTS